MWQTLDLNKMQKAVENKAELDKVFPGLMLEVKKNVDRRLAAKYPGKTSWFGPDTRPQMMASQPDLKEPINLDWTCFGFAGQPIRECHVGLLFDLHHWPLKYRIGVHAYSHIWEPLDAQLHAARKKMGGEYVYTYQADVTEHQLDDPAQVLDLAHLDAEVVKLSDRLEAIYDAFRPFFEKA